MKYSFVIDEKSLFIGVKNDYSIGQTATVHTPLNQSKHEEKWHNDIYDFIKKGADRVQVMELPDVLKDKCLPKTTSNASGKIVNFFVFSNFALDGVPFDVNYSFAMYVKEETDEYITQRTGKTIKNPHFGRQKLHYPISFAHISDGFNIDNKQVLNKILEVNGGFAYVVNGFDYDTDQNTLNFKTTMIGPEGVLLSNVFRRKKGVGVKLLVDGVSLDKSKVVYTTEYDLTDEEKNKFVETLIKIQNSSRSNGKKGEEFVFNNLDKILKKEPTEKLHISEKYPQSPYDIECVLDGEKIFIEVKSTGKGKKSFYMSKGERKFMKKYEDHYLLVLVTNVKSDHRKYFKYKPEEIMDEKIISQEIQDILFVVN